MSVLRSKRNLSAYEFENNFIELYNLTSEKLSKIAKRRKKWLCWEISAIMNSVANNIMEINDGYFTNGQKKKEKELLTSKSISSLAKLQKPLFALWNVEKYKTQEMSNWVKIMNKELALLNGLLSTKVEYENIIILDWRKIYDVNFLKNISELHRFTCGKVIKFPNKYDDTHSSLIVNLIDDAFYSLCMANAKIPKTANEYEKRKKNISKAISDLFEIQRPIRFYCNTMNYSESTLRDWFKMINEEIKMLYALQKSDKKRFSNLE